MPFFRRKKKEVEALPLPGEFFPDASIPMMLLVDRATGEQEYVREDQFKKDYVRIERSHKRKSSPEKKLGRPRKVSGMSTGELPQNKFTPEYLRKADFLEGCSGDEPLSTLEEVPSGKE